MATKTIKSGTMTPVRGGKGHMFGKQYAGPQKAGTEAHATKGSGGKWAKGGGKGNVGKQPKSSHSPAGRVAVSKGR